MSPRDCDAELCPLWDGGDRCCRARGIGLPEPLAVRLRAETTKEDPTIPDGVVLVRTEDGQTLDYFSVTPGVDR